MQARDIMTRNVITIAPGAPLSEAIKKMVEARVSGLPVVDAEGRLVGILTEGDLLRRVELATDKPRSRWQHFLLGPAKEAELYVKSHGLKVEDVMTRDVVAIGEEASIEQVAELMESRNIRRVPVLRGEVLVGIVSRADLIRVVGEALGARPQKEASDKEIREALLAELRKHRWFGAQSVSIEVENGVVILDGVLFEEQARKALAVAAESIPGVRGVEDRTTLAEPVPFVG
jgi:CBS domain-containing protein